MSITYNFEDCRYTFGQRRRASRWIKACIEVEAKCCGYINIVFCSDEYLLSVNRQFLGHDYYTDVITFPNEDSTGVCGDIYISIDTVAQNAIKYGVTPQEEMFRVIIHGVLHLCGYKDKSQAEATAMRKQEDRCLALRPEIKSDTIKNSKKNENAV